MADAPEQALFRVLGPFEVLVAGRAANLGGARQRLVLAGLVANANAVVSHDRLVDIVWGDEPPDTALTTVQKYVHRLRGALGERIVTRSPGYVLRIDHGESDVGRFEALLVDASRLTTAGELDDAIAAFDAALALWRGPAWAEFADFDFVRGEAARLDGLRATANEDRMEVALAAWRHTEVIGELEATIERYPLRERPRAQLMLVAVAPSRCRSGVRDRGRGEHDGDEREAELSALTCAAPNGARDAVSHDWGADRIPLSPRPSGASGRASGERATA